MCTIKLASNSVMVFCCFSAGVSIEVRSLDQYKQEIFTAGMRLVVVEFYAQWCGPCRSLEPTLTSYAHDLDIILLRVDVDENEDISFDEEISVMPTFKFYKVGVLDSIRMLFVQT